MWGAVGTGGENPPVTRLAGARTDRPQVPPPTAQTHQSPFATVPPCCFADLAGADPATTRLQDHQSSISAYHNFFYVAIFR